MLSDDELAHLKTWVGRTDRARAVVSPELVRRFRATLDENADEPEPASPAPLGIHWCLAPEVAAASALGSDGHPARGGFLPPVPLPRRMWAGGKLTFHDSLLVGDRVRRVSRVTAVEAKTGRSGPLCFVTVELLIRPPRGPAITERHDIVYRGPGVAAPAPLAAKAAVGGRREPFVTDSVLLFRYSAITFNGHRIHYDRDYARDTEGYPDLVVHGPLQATRLLGMAADMLGKPPTQFSFRGLSPLIVGRDAWLNGVGDANGLALWVEDADGQPTMASTARG